MKTFIVALTLSILSTAAVASGGLSIDNAPNANYQGAKVTVNPQNLAQGDIKNFDVNTKENRVTVIDTKKLMHGRSV